MIWTRVFTSVAIVACGATAAPMPAVVAGLLNTRTGSASTILGQLTSASSMKAAPTSPEQLESSLSSIWANNTNGQGFYDNIMLQRAAGIVPAELTQVVTSLVNPASDIDSTANMNSRDPSPSIFPKKSRSDAPYSISEAQLRAAIYIPSTFTYGKKRPTIFVPGTGVYGGETYAHNLVKLLTGASYADPVWLNIPGALLGDAQLNAEYVAYAANYISGVSSNKNVSVISWSQGGLDVQWALTFWPSTRRVVSDFVAVSPDFHGTILANALCLSTGNGDGGLDPCDASVTQQEYHSNFVNTLRAKGGADAYVPTTTVYSGFFDEVVEPQQGTAASAYLTDGRGVGVTNVEAQSVCADRLAGSFYGHAGMLFSPVTAALVVDALTHDGPGQVDRSKVSGVCGYYIAPGLSLADAVETAGEIVVAGIRLLAYLPKMSAEPALKAYAAA